MCCFLASLLLFMHSMSLAAQPSSLQQTSPSSSQSPSADSTYEEEESKIPKLPSIPPSLNQKTVSQHPHCERYFLYQGRKWECDSSIGNDADRLRSLMTDVPSALAEIDTYKSNRKSVRNAAYFGSLGILAVIAGVVVSHPPVDPTSGTIKTGGFLMLGGLGLSINSLIYGLSMIKNNEAHIGNAVQYYNAVHPENPIELQFSTPVNF